MRGEDLSVKKFSNSCTFFSFPSTLLLFHLFSLFFFSTFSFSSWQLCYGSSSLLLVLNLIPLLSPLSLFLSLFFPYFFPFPVPPSYLPLDSLLTPLSLGYKSKFGFSLCVFLPTRIFFSNFLPVTTSSSRILVWYSASCFLSFLFFSHPAFPC